MAIAARMPMITTTINSSMSVKPCRCGRMGQDQEWVNPRRRGPYTSNCTAEANLKANGVPNGTMATKLWLDNDLSGYTSRSSEVRPRGDRSNCENRRRLRHPDMAFVSYASSL